MGRLASVVFSDTVVVVVGVVVVSAGDLLEDMLALHVLSYLNCCR